MRPRQCAVLPRELLVDDREQPCPYFSDRIARLPLRMPMRQLEPRELDQRLEEGDRRWGRFLYRPACPACRACEPLRVEVIRLRLSRSQGRTRRRGDAELATQIGRPVIDDERLSLFAEHKAGRGLGSGERAMTAEDYHAFVVDRCVEAIEFRYVHEGRLVGIAIADRGATSLSAVYCYFDPGLPRLGIGTYSILRQVDYCQREGLRWLYLGYFIAGHPHMAYKARFLPHERLIDGEWKVFDVPREPAM